MTTTQPTAEASDSFIIAPAGGEYAVTNRVTGEFLGYYLTRSAADHAAVLAMRAITDAASVGCTVCGAVDLPIIGHAEVCGR